MTLVAFTAYLIIGILAGLLGGLLGIGGGLVSVPALLALFQYLEFPSNYMMQVAIGTSLGSMVFTAASSAYAHFLKKGINWKAFYLLSPGIFLGSIVGALVADYIPSKKLELIFGICECCIGIYFLLPYNRKEENGEIQFMNPIFLSIIGLGIGSISTILGIGGGIITVPILTAFGMSIRSSISTSAMTGFQIALIGAISFLYFGLSAKTWQGSIGYLYIPAFISIGIISSLAAPFGAKLAYSLPTKILRPFFGIVLIVVGVLIIHRS